MRGSARPAEPPRSSRGGPARRLVSLLGTSQRLGPDLPAQPIQRRIGDHLRSGPAADASSGSSGPQQAAGLDLLDAARRPSRGTAARSGPSSTRRAHPTGPPGGTARAGRLDRLQVLAEPVQHLRREPRERGSLLEPMDRQPNRRVGCRLERRRLVNNQAGVQSPTRQQLGVGPLVDQRPSSSTKMTSASTTISSRCATLMIVWSVPSARSCSWTARCIVASSADVASSRISSDGSRRSAAQARSAAAGPREPHPPLSHHRVVPVRQLADDLVGHSARAALRTASSELSSRPKRMLS